MAADTFTIIRDGLFYHLKNDRTGLNDVEYIDCFAEARNYRDEYTAAAQETEAEETAEHAEYLAQEREKDLIYRQVAALYDADKPANDPRNFAVTEILGAIDSLGRPVIEQKAAA